MPFPLPMHDGLPSRTLAESPLRGHAPLPDGVAARFEGALASVERDLGMPVEPLEPGSIFTHGSTGDDWFTLCAVEHLHGLGRDFVEEHMDVFSSNFRTTMAYALKIDPDEYMTARRRRFDHVRDLDLLLGDDTVLLTPTMCVEGFHPEGTGPIASRPTHTTRARRTSRDTHRSRFRPGGVPTASRSACSSRVRGSATTWS